MTNSYQFAAQLKALLSELEDDLGIGELAEIERNLILAVASLQELNGFAKSKDIVCHKFLQPASRPSIYRALQRLEKNSKIAKWQGKYGFYVLG